MELEDIQEQLEFFTVSFTNEVLYKMKELCYAYNCNAEHIVASWIAFSTSKKMDMKPTIKMLELMEKEKLMKKPKSVKGSKAKNSFSAPVYNSSSIDEIDDCSEVIEQGNKNNFVVNSPGMFSPNSVSPSCFTPSMKYATRKGSGDVVCSFGKQLDSVEWKLPNEFSCSVSAFNDKTVVKDSYYFMCEKLRDLASILNDMIQDAAQLYKDKYDIEDWGQIQLPSVETIPVVGRICADNTGKLSSSIFLEGSQEISSGQNICLDVSRLDHFSFFPGQIIAGSGVNSTGKKLVLENVLEGIFPPFCEKAPDLPNCYDSLSVVVAAGPFATSDTLSYEPLQDLMSYVKTHMPHVLILIGPFVDLKNQVIERDEPSEKFDEIFEGLVTQIISHIENLGTKVVLVPSIRDAHHNPVYPIPPFKAKHRTKRIYLASDPCILNIEGVLFGLTSTDILFHLGKEEISYPQLPDRLGRLCSHILTQRNFYPLYPPNEEMNIDYLHFENNAGIPVMPHILILPSDLRHFIKDINGCCCINPERLTKRVTGGTFTRIKVKPVSGNDYSGSIIDYIQAEILKI